jgi:LysM repeat protein
MYSAGMLAGKACPGAIYTVKEGDTCNKIAQAVGISVAAIVAANPGIDPACSFIMTDQKLCLVHLETPNGECGSSRSCA